MTAQRSLKILLLLGSLFAFTSAAGAQAADFLAGNITLEPIASSEAVLSQEEKEAGKHKV